MLFICLLDKDIHWQCVLWSAELKFVMCIVGFCVDVACDVYVYEYI